MPHPHLPHDHGQNMDHILEHLPQPESFQAVADLNRLLSDPSRTRIFWLLCHGEACVANLSAMVEMSSPAVSHHLKQLKAAGLIVSRREGKEVHYQAADTPTARALHHMTETLMAISCPAEQK
ncbi:MAG: winged helix-turn-helix transcriptional regulator [Ruminiclostridium sp.]|nr:winged helix-turn-helix transcriptional regulator [Ruminiclostridium sp.]